MPKINVYLPDELAAAVREAQVPVSAVCQSALEAAVRKVTAARASDAPPEADRPGVGLFGHFTPRARQALGLAQQAARDVPHDYVGTEHVLLGLIDEGGNLALKVIESLDVELGDLRTELVASFGEPTRTAGGHIPFTPLAKHALEITAKEALGFGHNYIGCEHLLLGLLATEEGTASQVLRRMGFELRTTRRAVVSALSGFVHAKSEQAARDDTSRQQASDARLDEIIRRLDAIEARLRAR